MGYIQKIFVLLALSSVIYTALAQVSQGGPHTSQGGPPVQQGGPHESQGRVKRQVDQAAEDNEYVGQGPPSWTTCDYSVEPRISCADCNTRLICKQAGGLLKVCRNPLKPHCNNGICSTVPSAECA